MKHRISSLLFVILLGTITIGYSQKPQNTQPMPMPVAPQMGQRPRVLTPNALNGLGVSEASKPLSTNYRITFSGKSGEKVIGELSSLTCSPMINIAGPLDASTTPTSFDVRGSIAEREGGQIFFEYQIGFQVPVTMSTHTSAPQGQGQGAAAATSTIQYQSHTCSGSILMKPGKAYEILRAGGCAHSVTITPEPDM